jgi:small subunit ribosomal protein S18
MAKEIENFCKKRLEIVEEIRSFHRPMSENTENEKHSRTPLDLGFMDYEILRRYVSESGKILPRRITGLTPKQQRHVARQVKRARQLLLMK